VRGGTRKEYVYGKRPVADDSCPGAGELLLLGTAMAFAADASSPSILKLSARGKLAVFALIAKDIGIKPRELLKELGGSSIAMWPRRTALLLPPLSKTWRRR